jgi:hypothetical protein
MKTTQISFLIYIATCLSSCKEPQPIKATNKAIQNQPQSVIYNPITDDQIQAAKKKLPLLHEGMSAQEVLVALGLSADYILSHGSIGGGPISFHWEVFQLNEHHHIILDSDYSRRKYTNVVISGVSIDGEGWRDEAHQNIQQ